MGPRNLENILSMFFVILNFSVGHLQGRTDPMGIRAMPWGPPPKGAHQTSKNNANQQKSVMKKAQLSFDNRRNIVRKKAVKTTPPSKNKSLFLA